MKAVYLFILCSLWYCNDLCAQTAEIKGVILDESSSPISSANIQSSSREGSQSNENGYYQLTIPAGKEVIITYSHISYKKLQVNVKLQKGESLEFNPILKTGMEQISEIVLSTGNREQLKGISNIDPEVVRKLPGANAGVENLLKTLPGVNSNNELSTQYSVRGGNYDENLVYVNGIEIYRTFLVRSGQQEGLSFINPDLVRKVEFSAGGFRAEYGDKLSSVLDITYKRPVEFEASVDLNFLGASASLGGVSENKKFTGIGGIRYRDNSLLVKSRETETNYHPRFLDAQTYLTYQFNKKFELEFLGNLSQNNYSFEPVARQTNFGTVAEPLALVIHYSGREEDRYITAFGAVKASYLVNDNFTARLIASVYNTREQEYFDILANYQLGQVNTAIGEEEFGQIEFSKGVGSQLTHARNDLDALILNLGHRGTYKYGEHQFEYGIKYTHEDIRDRIREYEIVDSAGFSLRPPLPDLVNNQPYETFEAPLLPFNSIRAMNSHQIDRLSEFLQWNKLTNLWGHEAWFSLGIRNHSWKVSGNDISSAVHSVVSPRAQFAVKPDWALDMLFRISGGWYHQPPFYKELRDASGEVDPDVKAQEAIHLVLANEYSFKLWERPFKLISEAYYKDLNKVNTYTLENVRIRYAADNKAEAYAFGLDLRLNGEFVPGTESWISFGYLKTEENSRNRGFIPRPTDQRLKFGLMFQDYVPEIPSLRMYLTMVYNTGLPGGSPSYADPYLYQSRLPDYKRADLGISYVFKDETKQWRNKVWLEQFEELFIGFEIYNLFDAQNSITNTFVRDLVSKIQYAVPNYLTPRVFNVKLGMKF